MRIPAAEIPYSKLNELIARNQVEEVTLQGSEVTATMTEALPIGPADAPTLVIRTRIPAFRDQDLMSLLEREGVEICTLAEELERHEALDGAQIDACPGAARERQGTDVRPAIAVA